MFQSGCSWKKLAQLQQDYDATEVGQTPQIKSPSWPHSQQAEPIVKHKQELP